MRTLRYIATAMLLTLALAAPRQRAGAGEGVKSTPLSAEEAMILAYISPYGASHRRVGLDVSVVAGASPCLQDGWVSLDVISSRPFPARGGIENHQYVAVNLNTGQVFNPIPIPAEEISTPEMAGVAAIMRWAHHISQAAFDRHRGEQPELKGPPPCAH